MSSISMIHWARFRHPLATTSLLASILLAGAAPAARASNSNWPRQFDSSSGSFIIYQPQPETLNGDLLTGRAAFSLQRPGATEPTFGVLWYAEQVQIDRDSSTVEARNFDVTKVRLPGISPADASRYEQLVESEALRWDLSGSLEELQAGLASAEKERASVADLDTIPPRVRFVPERAILVVFDGTPILEPIAGSGLERVSNTPYAIVHDRTADTYYLNGANLWYSAQDPLGPWSPMSNPPPGVIAAVPPDTNSADQYSGAPPRVITATEPTELISTDGPPQYAPLVEGELLYVTNTESDVVREISTQRLYVLLAGRWYRASTSEGPWSYVRGDRLPRSFSRIPPASPKANLLASVAGTGQADDAIADAEIPQTSTIRRDASDLDVAYDGPAEFEPIDGTHMKYAVNSDAEVLFADGRYYACDQGVWFVADDPDGPWRVSDTRPIEVDEISPSCPVYDVRYVYIYDYTPDVVVVGYLPGYLGCYPFYGTVVYGTGYRYRAWRGHRRYFPRPCTWGFGPRYNPWLSRWSFGFSYWSGFLRVGFNWHSSPKVRAIRDPVRWLGPGGYRRPLLAADHTMIRSRQAFRTPVVPAEHAPMNLYRRPANLPRVGRVATPAPVRPAVAPEARPARTPNNVFAGKDGRVYRREDNGWKVNRDRSWVPAPVTTTPPPPPSPPVGSTVPAMKRNWPVSPPAPQRTPSAPSTPPAPPPVARPPRPAAPPISPTPGDLEREFRGRSRTSAPVVPAKAPPPAQNQPKGVQKQQRAQEGKR